MVLLQNKFEKHALVIFSLPFIGLLIERIAYWSRHYDGPIYNILSGICTAMWFAAMIWGAGNLYFIWIQKNSVGRKIFWCVISLSPVLYILGLLLSIELKYL